MEILAVIIGIILLRFFIKGYANTQTSNENKEYKEYHKSKNNIY